MSKHQKREKKSTVVSGLIFLGSGLYLMGIILDVLPRIEQSWPVFFIIVGLAIIGGAMFKNRDSQESSIGDQPDAN